MKRSATILLMGGMALTAAALPVGSAGAGAREADCGAEVRPAMKVETMQVTLAPQRRIYRRGQTARIEVTVTRGAPGHGVPAPGVDTSVLIEAGRRTLFYDATTDIEGRFLAKIRIPRRTRIGAADGSGCAFSWYVPFAHVEEYGYLHVDDLIRIVR